MPVRNSAVFIMFFENEQHWQATPKWADFLVHLGFRFHDDTLGQRRISLVSMPCDSAAAGLIALGALIRDLGNPDASNVKGHYNAMLRYARQYLENCRNCSHPCKPEKVRCGYAVRATGWVRNWCNKPSKRYRISEKTNLAKNELWYSHKGGSWWQDPRYCLDWEIDGLPPPQLDDSEGVLDEEIYRHIIKSAKIIRENTRKSFSGLCLAGRVTGKKATRKAMDSVRFLINKVEYRLPKLLTVNGWSPFGSVSRMSFFNSRTGSFDLNASEISLVVADGDKSFVRALGLPAFQRSDVIGVISRVLGRDDLEAVGNRIQGLRQWYTDDKEAIGKLPSVPKGISLKVFKRRVN